MNIKQIVSKKDPLIQEILCLKKTKEIPFYFAEGMRVVKTIVQHNAEVVTYIFVTKIEFLQDIGQNILSKCILVSEHIMKTLSHVKTVPGIIAVCTYTFKTGMPDVPGLVCYNISDPGNLGTLFRGAVAFGAKSVICIDGVDPLHPKVIQASAGTINAISLYKMSEDRFFELTLKKHTIIALSVKIGKQISLVEKNQQYFIVMGSEAHGLPKRFVDRCSFALHIPMKGTAESLNVAIAGSIAMYELF